jgi:hypothetical protein
MNRYNQTGGSNAFLMVFSCAGTAAGADMSGLWVMMAARAWTFATIQAAI